MRSPCPPPESLIHMVSGTASAEEIEKLTLHAATCPECAGELDSLRAAGPPGEWTGLNGSAVPMPERLWRDVSRLRAPLHLRVLVAVEKAGAFGFELLKGTARLVPVPAAAVRGDHPEMAGSGAQPAGMAAGRLIDGPHEALVRLRKDRLTIVITSHGAPASGRSVFLIGPDRNETTVTDASGVAVFKNLGKEEYILELEGMECDGYSGYAEL